MREWFTTMGASTAEELSGSNVGVGDATGDSSLYPLLKSWVDGVEETFFWYQQSLLRLFLPHLRVFPCKKSS